MDMRFAWDNINDASTQRCPHQNAALQPTFFRQQLELELHDSPDVIDHFRTAYQ